MRVLRRATGLATTGLPIHNTENEDNTKNSFQAQLGNHFMAAALDLPGQCGFAGTDSREGAPGAARVTAFPSRGQY